MGGWKRRTRLTGGTTTAGSGRHRCRLAAVVATVPAAVLVLAACRAGGVPLTSGAAPPEPETELVGSTDSGKKVGNVTTAAPSPETEDEPTRAFVVDEATGAREELDLIGGVVSRAVDVTDNGVVVGWVTMADGDEKPVAWNLQDGTEQELSEAGYEEAEPQAANGSRVVVGKGTTGEAAEAVLWRPDGIIETLAPRSRFTTASTAVDVNESGIVVGELTGHGCCERSGFVWSREQGLRRLPGLGASEAGEGAVLGEATATGINDRGDIVGWVSDANGRHAARWDAESLQLTLVPDLGAGGELFEVNDEGIALGESRPAGADAAVPYCVNLETGRAAPVAGPDADVRAVEDDGTVVGTDNGRAATWDTDDCK